MDSGHGSATQWIRLPDDYWQGLYQHGQIQRHKPDTLLYQQYAPLDQFYIVKSGRVRITINDAKGHEKALFICESGSMFGEFCCFSEKSSEMAAIIVETVVYAFDRRVMRNVIAADPDLNWKMLCYQYNKTSILSSQLEDFCFRDAYNRVVSQLIKLSQTHGTIRDGVCCLDIRFTLQNMADMTGISRVSASHVFKRLVQERLVEKQGSLYCIPDISKLYRML